MTIYRDVVRGSPIGEHANQIFRLIALYAREYTDFILVLLLLLEGTLTHSWSVLSKYRYLLLHIVALINCMISLFRKLHSKAMDVWQYFWLMLRLLVWVAFCWLKLNCFCSIDGNFVERFCCPCFIYFRWQLLLIETNAYVAVLGLLPTMLSWLN